MRNLTLKSFFPRELTGLIYSCLFTGKPDGTHSLDASVIFINTSNTSRALLGQGGPTSQICTRWVSFHLGSHEVLISYYTKPPTMSFMETFVEVMAIPDDPSSYDASFYLG